MTHTERDQQARTRGKLARERGAERRLATAIEARRRLDALQTNGTPATAHPSRSERLR